MAAAAAAAAAEDGTEEGLSGTYTQPERGAAAVGEEEGRENTEEDGGRGAVDDGDGAHRAAAAESLATRLQKQLEEMKVRGRERDFERLWVSWR